MKDSATEVTTLDSRLRILRNYAQEHLTQRQNDLMQRHIDELYQGGALDKVVKTGSIAPSFELVNQYGQTVSSKALLEKGSLVVSFYRGGWCPYCLEELKALNNAYAQIRKTGADLVAISSQGLSDTQRQAAKIESSYNMLVDEGNATGKAFGLVYEMPQYLRELYWKDFGNSIPEKNESAAWELPIPARIIIGQDGRILDVKVDPDYRYRPEPSETITFLRNL